jgi:signal transduction histidine kinase/DNA-binding response OmpR family regulator
MGRQLQDLYSNLENRVADRTKELSAVNSVAEVVSRSLDLNRVLPDALAKTLEVMEMDAGAIFRLDPLSNQLVLVVEQGLNPDVRQLALDLPIEYSIVSEVMETRKPAARLLTKYPEGPVKAILHQAGVRLVVSIPLLSQEKVFGAINVLSFTDIYPTPEELSAAAAIGQQIGVAMENARLFAQTAAYAQAMEKARMAADEANASKSSFVANVSHELRTPLTSILGFASLVQKRLKERILPHTDIHDERVVRSINQVQENLHIIISESQRLTSLINDVLDLEKIEAGKMEWQMQRLQIEQVIELSIANTASLFEGSSLKLKSVITHELPEIIGDKDKLLQVMINLLSNAVKFTSRGQVTIRAELHNQKVIVSVSDTGIGITTEDLPKIFEKFKQVGDSLTAKPKGTGLGLPIVKEIVEHHGGQVWVESTPGIGSIFYFSLPAVGSRFIADPGDSLMLDPFVKDLSKHLLETQSTQNNDTFCILIVEEDPYIRKLLHEQMESERCQIVEAVDLSSAISSLNCSSPDLIILDKMMQDATDEEIGSFIKANLTFTHAPILLVMTDERDQDCYQIVVDSYFSRPRDLNHLIHETQFLMHQKIKGKKILIVDQDESRIKAIQTDLITQGFEVLTARDIPEGIIRASAYHPNLLVIESSLSVRNDPVKWDRFEKEMMGAFIMLYQLDVNPE